jgi:hypothetical protein
VSPKVKLPETAKFPDTVKSFFIFNVVPSNVKFDSAVRLSSPSEVRTLLAPSLAIALERPEEPEVPDEPEVPELPDEPLLPEDPDVPELPELPLVPASPESPVLAKVTTISSSTAKGLAALLPTGDTVTACQPDFSVAELIVYKTNLLVSCLFVNFT